MSDTPPPIREMSDKASMLLTGRQYAAIHLCVPDSGEKWLDDMITQSLRDKFAAAALQGMLADPDGRGSKAECAADAYWYSKVMLERRTQ